MTSVPFASLLLTLFGSVQTGPSPAPTASSPTATTTIAYADAVDLVQSAQLVIDATIRSATRLKDADVAGLSPGMARLYIEADVTTLIRGPGAVSQRVGYVLDLRTDGRGRTPTYKKARVILFARPSTTGTGQVQLVAKDAQLGWTAALDALVRRAARDLAAPDVPPAVTGIGRAFHVPGSLPGEGETQVFLNTGNGRPVSLKILRRPGEQPSWGVALGEIVDDAAGPPARDTLLWYRLACGLPAALPDESIAGEEPDNAQAARDDYSFVLKQLGPCTRRRVP